jgi:transcriptional regulator with XRE-family HTH domain
MVREFNKKRLFDNINYLIGESGKKIGELETEAGVSPGYISRASKDGGTKPGIEFIMNIAEILHVSVDMLLKVDIASLTPTERYLVSFLEKINTDTIDDKLDWERESADGLNRQERDIDPDRNIEHPLFRYETFYEPNEEGYSEEISRVVFVSHSFDCHTAIKGDCYHISLKNGAKLYLMNISKSVYRTSDPNAFAKEIWMCVPGSIPQFLCSNRGESELEYLVDSLYASVCENSKHPKVKKDIKYIIDAFMRDDIEDDPATSSDNEIPF